jgi:hypothetical protein
MFGLTNVFQSVLCRHFLSFRFVIFYFLIKKLKSNMWIMVLMSKLIEWTMEHCREREREREGGRERERERVREC